MDLTDGEIKSVSVALTSKINELHKTIHSIQDEVQDANEVIKKYENLKEELTTANSALNYIRKFCKHDWKRYCSDRYTTTYVCDVCGALKEV